MQAGHILWGQPHIIYQKKIYVIWKTLLTFQKISSVICDNYTSITTHRFTNDFPSGLATC